MSTSTVEMMYDNSTARLVEVITEATHYADMAKTKIDYINSNITSLINLMENWTAREPSLADRWTSDRAYLHHAMKDLQRKLDRAVTTQLDTVFTLDNVDEPIKAGGSD